MAIERIYAGRVFQESRIKEGLRKLNPDIHFDMGAALNMYHPGMDNFQGVFHLGRWICSMDRGNLVEFPVWSTSEQMERIPAEQLTISDVMDHRTIEEFHVTPFGNVPSGFYSVYRTVKDDLLCLGWRNLLYQMAGAHVRGVTAQTIGKELGIDPLDFTVPEHTLPEVQMGEHDAQRFAERNCA